MALFTRSSGLDKAISSRDAYATHALFFVPGAGLNANRTGRKTPGTDGNPFKYVRPVHEAPGAIIDRSGRLDL